MIQKLSWRRLLREGFLITLGSFIFAIGIDCFEIPHGLAAGGLTGIATTFSALAAARGVYLPVGIQTIVMNVLLLIYVVATTRDFSYVARSIYGIIISGFFTDMLAPLVPVLAQDDLLLAAIWGGVVVGVGLGIVFLSGGNTGGTDIVCQLIAKRSGLPLGVLAIIVDGIIVAASAPVFSLMNALYATVALYISGRVIDAVVAGPRTARMAFIVSDRHAEIAREIMYVLGRGCTELRGRGVWSGNDRPVLMCILGKTETMRLKAIVEAQDPSAIMIVSEVHEAFGEGFGSFS